jgi:hypothetical protein
MAWAVALSWWTNIFVIYGPCLRVWASVVFAIVNAVVLLQFLLTMQNMPVAAPSQTNDFAGVVSNLSPTSSSFSSALEFVSSSYLRMEPFLSFKSCVLGRHINKVASGCTVQLNHWEDEYFACTWYITTRCCNNIAAATEDCLRVDKRKNVLQIAFGGLGESAEFDAMM